KAIEHQLVNQQLPTRIVGSPGAIACALPLHSGPWRCAHEPLEIDGPVAFPHDSNGGLPGLDLFDLDAALAEIERHAAELDAWRAPQRIALATHRQIQIGQSCRRPCDDNLWRSPGLRNIKIPVEIQRSLP